MDNVLLTTTKWGEEKLFESLWQDEDLSDVTLVCKDGSQVMAHRTVLALSSPLLRAILTKSKRQDPVLLLLTIDHQVLDSLLKLVYFGEVRVPQDHLGSLLQAAEELQISLLQNTDGWQQTPNDDESRQILNTNLKQGEVKTGPPDANYNLGKRIGIGKSDVVRSKGISIAQEQDMGDNFDNSESSSTAPHSERKSSEKQTDQKNTCNECGQEFEAFNHLWVHIQSVHQSRHKCKICKKAFKSVSILNQHVDSAHNGILLVCEDCGKKFGWQATLNKHIRRQHPNNC